MPTPNPIPLAISIPAAMPGGAPAGAGMADTQLVSLSGSAASISNTGIYTVDRVDGTALTLSGQITANGVNTVVVSGGTIPLPGTNRLASFSNGSAVLQEAPGFDAATGTYWGRWGTGFTLTDPKTGKSWTATSNNHTIYSPHVTSEAELDALRAAASGPNANPQIVNATYTYVGGTSPTRSDGAVGKVNSLNVTANFSSQMITDYKINLQFSNGATTQAWDAHSIAPASFSQFTGTGPSAAGGSQGLSLVGSCTGCATTCDPFGPMK